MTDKDKEIMDYLESFKANMTKREIAKDVWGNHLLSITTCIAKLALYKGQRALAEHMHPCH